MKTSPIHGSRFLAGLLGICLLFFFLFNQGTAKTNDFKEARVYITSQSGDDRLADHGFRAFEPLEQPDENYPTIMIDLDKTFQTIEGFGGAFTDATAINFAKLTPAQQDEFITACFDPVEGNGYTLCRTTIHSCDYSDEMYTYDDVTGDKELKHFSIEHDRKYRLPLIKKALAATGGKLKIYASPWSPPPWMKTNGEMKHGGKLKPEYFQTWADYFVKYVKAYQQEGIPIWGLTVQNEPMAVQVWESCVFTAAEERDFVRDYLGPTLKKSGLGDLKLMIWDHNRGIMYQRAEVVYDDPQAAQYVWGTAFHYYVGDHFDNVRMVHDAFPDKKLLYTEAGMGGDWRTGVNIARNMIMDLNNWTVGWTFWNMLMDENKAPRHAGGLGGGSIVEIDTQTGELSFNPPYYYYGHFSRFIKTGAKRIACTSNSDDFIATAFINPDDTVAVVILNLSDAERIYQMWVDDRVLKGSAPPKGITTLVF
ncbi:MAG TPA: glycoside hydrolase family 30 protein [bacterium]|nr:glycoside hydrolase family 30 protein [bacterium]HPN45748.1 glycoside hydrolase family 30 protein [bacterium]